MNKEESAIIVAGYENFKHSEKCEGCDKCTNPDISPPIHEPKSTGCDSMNPGRITVEPSGPQVFVSQEKPGLWTALEDDGKERPGDALNIQIGGNHYKDFSIQPVEFITENRLGFLVGSVIKRMCRYNKDTGKGLQDLQKAKHEIDLLIELEEWT